jgi:aryl-alcohol dehydrogenase-like predicted oxidoreductase
VKEGFHHVEHEPGSRRDDAHLRENVAAADLILPADAVAELDSIGG